MTEKRRKQTRRGMRQRTRIFEQEARRLGTTTKYLKSRWKEVKKQTDAYRKWRDRMLKKLTKDTGLSAEEIEKMGYLPPKMSAKLSEFENLEQMTRFLQDLKKTRTTFHRSKEQHEAVVREARKRMDEIKAKREEERRQRKEQKEEYRKEHFHRSQMTKAQKDLLNLVYRKLMLSDDEYYAFLDEIAQLDDFEIAHVISLDKSGMKLFDSPKDRTDEENEVVDATTNEDRIRYVKDLISRVRKMDE